MRQYGAYLTMTQKRFIGHFQGTTRQVGLLSQKIIRSKGNTTQSCSRVHIFLYLTFFIVHQLLYLHRSLAPGAQTLIKTMTKSTLPPSERVDVTKLVANLTVSDWASLIRAFDEWPFAPEVSLRITFGVKIC